MIDYEKLKQEIDLIHKRMYVQKDESLNEDAKALCVSICHSLDSIYTCLNELIARDVAQPKYTVGQTVYLMGIGNNCIESIKIDEIIYDEGDYWYLVFVNSDERGEFDQYREDVLYPSKLDFIDSQINYWKSFKNDDLESPYDNEKVSPGRIDALKQTDNYKKLFNVAECKHEPFKPISWARVCEKCKKVYK